MARRLGLRAFLGTVGLATALGVGGGAAGAEPVVPLADKDVHMGVATCAGSTCHGAVEPWPGSQVLQNEFVTWQRHDKHAKAYEVLLNERSKRIARNLGLKDAHTADVCLDCHADNVPAARRHRFFQISDGVTCEACHGGAGRWIGTHISADGTHKRNIQNGLYPSADPVTRARLCLSCHFGDETRFVTHRMMGAGHPRMSFELDTFAAIQPAHFKVDGDYRKRKGSWSGVQTWAIGQAMAIGMILDTLLDPERGRDGAFPELVLFDCHTCHRPMSGLKWRPRDSVGLGPGTVRLHDSNLLMLRIIADKIDPALGKSLRDRMHAIHKATTESHARLLEEARALKEVTGNLVARFAAHKFGKEDVQGLLQGLIGYGLGGEYHDYSGAEQATMALGTLINPLKATRAIDEKQFTAMNAALEKCYAAVEKDEAYQPTAFIKALTGFKAAVPQF